MRGAKRESDSAMEQFVFFWEKVSVAAMNMLTSCFCGFVVRDLDMASTPDVEDGMALGS